MPTAADLRAFVREATTNQSSTTEGTSTNQECDGHVHSQAFKIVVLGSACCGKTSIIKQFVGNGQDFEEQYEPTEKKTSYFKTILTFDTNTQRITHWAVKLVDVPVTEVPVGSAGSWNSWLSFDVTAAAYVLVFDVSAHLHSFEFVRTIRDQLINHPSTSSALIFIAANKVDLSYQLNRSDVAQIVSPPLKSSVPASREVSRAEHLMRLPSRASRDMPTRLNDVLSDALLNSILQGFGLLNI
ncbi:hypothetical protein RvY_13745 [Ramazzottius varieornatus]|uniref:Uncharacterized protein n=1 Tax=Ramazzottius varieornatus TaxID=947166 RepID=A0A1D1VQS1_RAMVA|nr:hypothetical protein RvY_13745 [Ramazzottius varieornatus]